LGVFYTNNLLGVLLASMAATASLRATLRRARIKDELKTRQANGAV
jgi:hypothetical protein